VSAFAAHLAVQRKTVMKWITAGVLPAYRFNGQWRIARVDALGFVQRARLQS
jgi:excisionase family DNA binding protein